MDIDYRLGLDIGITSVGWAVIENNSEGDPVCIVNMGSRIFECAEVPKTGASLAEPRRMARSARRRTRRRRFRKERMKQLFEAQGLISSIELEGVFNDGRDLRSVYELRFEALSRKLTNEEWARVLLHLAQRRGYKSNSKADEAADKERGKLLQAVETNRALMSDKKYRTVGEMLWLDEKFRSVQGAGDSTGSVTIHTPRNKTKDYTNTLPRDLLVEEIHELFKAQRACGSCYAGADFENAYMEIFASQRSFDEGPGTGSPYAGNQIERMLGMDETFELDEKKRPTQPRAVKASFTFEYFKLLEDLNHIKIVQTGQAGQALTAHQRELVIALAFKTPDIKYSRLRKELSLTNEQRFNTINYGSKAIEEAEKQSFKQMQSYHKIRKAVNAAVTNIPFESLSREQLDEIGRILTLYKNDEKRLTLLNQAGIDASIHEALLPLNFSKAGKLSIIAMKKLTPYLEQGMTYDKACLAVYGYHTRQFSDKRVKKLNLRDHCEEIANPVVRRAVAQTIKVVNAVVREYGPPQLVCIELAREMSKTHDERTKIDKENKENQAENERIAKQVEEYKGAKATGQDIVKFKLFKEQDGICLYSGERLDISRLFETGYVDVDHIIPYSTSFDNSYRNKVLVKSSENRQKGNCIPAQYLTGERWDKFQVLTNTVIRDYKKRERLLKSTWTEEDEKGFRERNLTDTKYITRVVYNMINDNLEFAPHPHYKKPVIAVNGAVTAYVRGRWGINKLRGDGDLHHAVDAVVIACITDRMIQQISTYSKNVELLYKKNSYYVDYNTGKALTLEEYRKRDPHFPPPWDHFRNELDARLSSKPDVAINELCLPMYLGKEPPEPLFVSRAPRRKVTGSAHEDTIRSAKKDGYSVSKTPLTSLKLKNDEIEGYYNQESDTLLYNALKARLQLYDGDAKAAFADPFYKPRADGSQGPLVKKVKIYEKCSIGIPVNNGVAKNENMVRVDLFYVEGEGYYFVPIYVADTVKKTLPRVAATSRKVPLEMKEDDFLFSIYPSDLLKVVSDKGVVLNRTKYAVTGEPQITRKEAFLYFVSADASGGKFNLITHDNKYLAHNVGINSLAQIEKYEVDVLGEYHKVNAKGKRMGF